MAKSHAIIKGSFFFALLGIAFCIWSALGNDVNFCVTTGCALYQDFNVGGISLWWVGTAAFTVLCACALMGQHAPGRMMAALFVAGDICLLSLLALTAPCVSCLVAALLFALCYLCFRRAPAPQNGQIPPGRSILLWIWLFLFVVNIGQVMRSQIDIWPIFDESGEAKTRMFFSPSCRFCIEGINVLSGNINVAFYPVAETEADIYRLIKMKELLAEGMTIAEALGQSADAKAVSFLDMMNPDNLLLRFRLLANKAHVFASGSQGVPFFENFGLTPDIVLKLREKNNKTERGLSGDSLNAGNTGGNENKNHELPSELSEFGQCIGEEPCPPQN